VTTLEDVVDQLKKLNDGMESPGDRRERELEQARANEQLAKTLAGLKGGGQGGSPTVVNQNIGGGPLGLGGLAFGLGGLAKGLGIGIGAAGAGIGAFFMGLAGAEAIMSRFGSGDNLKNLLVNLADGLKAFGDRELVALGAVLGAGALFGAVPLLSGGGAGIGIGAVGLGLGAFFAGLGAGEAGLNWMNVDGARLSKLMKHLAEGLKAFGDRDLAILGTLLGGAAAGGALFGASAVPGAIVGMGAMGLGIGAFFAGLATADAAANYMKVDGSKLKAMMTNLAEGLSAFDNQSLVVLGGLLGAGALFGAAAGPLAAAGATIGMAAIGLGIGGFFAGLSVGEAAMSLLGADGSGIRDMMVNLADGLVAFAPLADFDAVAVGAGLAAIGGGLAAFFGGSLLGNVMEKADTFINWLSGDETDRKTRFENIVDQLKPLQNIDVQKLSALDKVSIILDKFADSLSKLSNVKMGSFKRDVIGLGTGLSTLIGMMPKMLNGGIYAGMKPNPDDPGRPIPVDLDFGAGLANAPLNEIADKLAMVRRIMAPIVAPAPITETNLSPAPGAGQGFGVLMNNGGNTVTGDTNVSNNYALNSGPVNDSFDNRYDR
jgi:hypothetical protein